MFFVVSENAELIGRLFRAFGDSDLQTIKESLAKSVQSHTPGRSQLAGTASGREAVIAQLGKSRELSGGTYRITVEDTLGGEAHAAVVYRGRATRGGRSLDLLHIALYRIDQEQIQEIWFTPLDQAAFDEFWS